MINPAKDIIRGWALAAVAATSITVIATTGWLIYLLAVPDWCGRAIGAVKQSDARPEYAVGGCFNLLNKQVEALAVNSWISLGTLALCLAVLVIIVLAGGHVSFKASRDGVEADVSQAAQVVADAAQDKADVVKEQVTNA